MFLPELNILVLKLSEQNISWCTLSEGKGLKMSSEENHPTAEDINGKGFVVFK